MHCVPSLFPETGRSTIRRRSGPSNAVVSRSSTLYSNTSEATYRTAKSTRSVASSTSTLVATNNKFTQKWPKPEPVRALGKTRLTDKTLVEGLEDGQGLGIDFRTRSWTTFKWCLLLSVCTVFIYGLAGMICAIQTWFKTWDHADVMYVADRDILILITLASSILLFTALVGMTGTVLNSRPLLAVYSLLLWPALLSIATIGYVSYKRVTFSFDQKLNYSWNNSFTPLGRLVIQNALRCCGYYNSEHAATPSKRCYTRTPLPACKGKLLRFERENLATIWSVAFSIVPLHLANIITSLICANHITKTFGKGLTPRQYRLTVNDVIEHAERMSQRQEHALPLMRPKLSKASSSISGIFREDRKDRLY